VLVAPPRLSAHCCASTVAGAASNRLERRRVFRRSRQHGGWRCKQSSAAPPRLSVHCCASTVAGATSNHLWRTAAPARWLALQAIICSAAASFGARPSTVAGAASNRLERRRVFRRTAAPARWLALQANTPGLCFSPAHAFRRTRGLTTAPCSPYNLAKPKSSLSHYLKGDES
jgi:hypothetical protein